MRMNCEIIQDLIPVYHDGIASEETSRAMRLHLKNCPDCRRYYAQYCRSMQLELAAEAEISRDAAGDAFASLSRRMRRRRMLSTASLSAMGAVAAAAAVLLIFREIHHSNKK